MSDANKTPWQAAGGMASSPARVFAKDGELIATVEGDWVTSEPAKRAALIAAAPEMLKALEDVIWALGDTGASAEMRDEILLLIAKAKGEL